MCRGLGADRQPKAAVFPLLVRGRLRAVDVGEIIQKAPHRSLQGLCVRGACGWGGGEGEEGWLGWVKQRGAMPRR